MCGIFGVVDFTENMIHQDRVQSATKTISHRGPDHDEVFVDRYVGLGHTRLSIVDLSASANQPFTTANGRFTMVYNGEVYNYQSIRKSLEQVGVKFRTDGDTEVVAEAYSVWGIESLRRLNGIFAFACWDKQEQELTLARDRFGVKPLYYRCDDSELVVGSEIKSILKASPDMDRKINAAALHEYLYFGVALGGKTLFQNIDQLAPASYAVWRRGDRTLKTTTYWQPSTVQYAGNVQSAIEETRERLEAAVSRQLTGDVPIGLFLSGGLDSSCIAAYAAKNYSSKIKTYSVAFDFAKNSELPLAKMVAERFKTDHHEINISGAGLQDTVMDLVRSHDVPFGDSANIPLYLLCQEVGDIKVVLQGDGGDEVFGGYRRYATLSKERLYRSLAQLLRVPGARGLVPYRVRRYLECFLPRDRGERFARLLTTETTSNPPTDIFHTDIVQQLAASDPFARYKQISSKYDDLDSVQAMLLTDLQIVLPDVFLEKVDRSTMAHGIEVRVPLLENDLVDFLVSLPSSFKVRDGEQKWLLRQSLRGVIPDEVIDAKKSGFGVPYSAWLRKPLKALAVDSMQVLIEDGLFDKDSIEKKMASHRGGSDEHAFLLWKAFQLSLWLNEYKVKF